MLQLLMDRAAAAAAAAATALAAAEALVFSHPSRNSPQGPIPALANRKEMGPWASVAARTAAKTFFFFFEVFF